MPVANDYWWQVETATTCVNTGHSLVQRMNNRFQCIMRNLQSCLLHLARVFSRLIHETYASPQMSHCIRSTLQYSLSARLSVFHSFCEEEPPPARSTPWEAYWRHHSYVSISASAHQPGEHCFCICFIAHSCPQFQSHKSTVVGMFGTYVLLCEPIT